MQVTKIITAVVVGVAVLGLVIWDLVVNFNKVEGDTISEMFSNAAIAYPILVVVLGVVVGHLASYMPGSEIPARWLGQRLIFGLVYGIVGGFFWWNIRR